MKKSIILALVLLFVFSGCATVEEEINIDTTVAYEESNVDYVFVGPTNFFEEKEFNDTNAPQTVTADILDKTYELTYVCSKIYPFEVMTVNVYTTDELKVDKYIPEIHIDVETGNVVNYVHVPYPETLKTETDYTQFIAELVTSEIDLSKFDYSCETSWVRTHETGCSAENAEGFKSNFAENESFSRYDFDYEKFVDGIKVNNEITASFMNTGTFSLKIIDFEFDEELVKEYLAYLPTVDKIVEKFFRSTATDDITVTKIQISDRLENRKMVISGDRYYITTRATATFYTNNDRWGVKYTPKDPGVRYKHFVTDVTDFILADSVSTADSSN